MANKQSPADGSNGGGGSQGHQYVRVHAARNLIEAEFLQGLLVSNGIAAILEDGASESVGMPASLFGRGVPILVPDVQVDEARRLIADHAESRRDVDDEEGKEEEEPAG